MYKKIILGLTLLGMSGCAPKTIVSPQVISQSIISQQIVVRKTLLDSIREFEKTHEIGLNVRLPNSVKMGKFVNLMATPNMDGYLKLVVINPNDKASTVLPNRYDSGFVRANTTLNTDHKDFGIQTFPPKGLHHILVLFSEKKTRSNHAVLSTLQNVQNGEYGRAYVKLFAIDIH
jgi:hypothetical protein